MKKFLIFAVLAFGAFAHSQESLLKYNGSGSYVYIERTDLRRYDNGKYTGLASREVRSFVTMARPPAGASAGDKYYDGNFYVIENTVRNSAEAAKSLNESIPSSFRITPEGELVMTQDNGYPTFRSFPAFTTQKIKVGDKWQAKAERAVDPLNKGVFTRMPIHVEYTYLRDEKFRGEDVFVFSAQWATRYGITYWDFGGDSSLASAQGSHKATMYVSKRTGNALVVRDTVDETFIYADKTQVSYKGSISLFTEYPPALDRSRLIPALQRVADVSEGELEKIVAEKPSDKLAQASDSKSADSGPKGSGENSDSGRTAQARPGQKPASPPSAGKNAKDDKPRLASAGLPSNAAENKVTVESTEAGLRLTIQDLKFKPDSAELLPGESVRLDGIAEVLRQAPDQMFLVEGHTASVGNPRGEKQLSVERANSIAEALIARGIKRDKFICKGSGGTRPVADNSTPEGKARNRRVEITILE